MHTPSEEEITKVLADRLVTAVQLERCVRIFQGATFADLAIELGAPQQSVRVSFFRVLVRLSRYILRSPELRQKYLKRTMRELQKDELLQWWLWVTKLLLGRVRARDRQKR